MMVVLSVSGQDGASSYGKVGSGRKRMAINVVMTSQGIWQVALELIAIDFALFCCFVWSRLKFFNLIDFSYGNKEC